MVAVLLLGTQFAAFLGVAILVIVTPGQDTALTIRNTLLGGRAPQRGLHRPGVSAGNIAWAVATSAGVAALLAFGSTFAALGLVWLSAHAFAVAKAGDLLLRPRVRRLIDAVVGLALIAFGARLASDPR